MPIGRRMIIASETRLAVNGGGIVGEDERERIIIIQS